MVENEITRLESQVKHLQDDVKREKQANEWGRAAPKSQRPNDQKVASLHFISKAIKGDYHLTNNAKGFALQEQGGAYREKHSKRHGLLKPPSPLRDPRHPTPRVYIQTFPFMLICLTYQVNKLYQYREIEFLMFHLTIQPESSRLHCTQRKRASIDGHLTSCPRT